MTYIFRFCVSPIFILFSFFFFFFFNDTATTEIYTLSLTTLFRSAYRWPTAKRTSATSPRSRGPASGVAPARSEEHTSELQSRGHLVCRLLLEKKKRHIKNKKQKKQKKKKEKT